MITDMILEYPEATATWRLWCQRSSQVRSSPQQRLLCWYSMMKATINAPTLGEQANASSSPQQNATSSNTITVLNVLPLTTSFTVSANSVVNLPITFSSTTTGGTGPYAVSWSFGDGSTSSGATVTHSYSTAQTYTVTESVKDSSGPRQTARPTSASILRCEWRTSTVSSALWARQLPTIPETASAGTTSP